MIRPDKSVQNMVQCAELGGVNALEAGHGSKGTWECLLNGHVSRFRDQHAVCSFHRLPVGPLTLTTTPVPLRKPCARHDLNFAGPQERRTSVCGRWAAFRSSSIPLDAALRSPVHLPARRPQTEAYSSSNLFY
jgi:hypothetical protein